MIQRLKKTTLTEKTWSILSSPAAVATTFLLKWKPVAWRCAHVHVKVLLLFYVSIIHTDKKMCTWDSQTRCMTSTWTAHSILPGSKTKAGSLPPGLSSSANSQTKDTPPGFFRQRCDSTTNEKKNSQMKALSQFLDEDFKPQLNTLMYIICLFVLICWVSVYTPGLTESTSLEECRGGGSSSDSSEDSGFRFFFFPILMTIFLWGGEKKKTHTHHEYNATKRPE